MQVDKTGLILSSVPMLPVRNQRDGTCGWIRQGGPSLQCRDNGTVPEIVSCPASVILVRPYYTTHTDIHRHTHRHSADLCVRISSNLARAGWTQCGGMENGYSTRLEGGAFTHPPPWTHSAVCATVPVLKGWTKPSGRMRRSGG